VLKELQNMGKKAALAPFEIIDGVVLTDSEWSSQNVHVHKDGKGSVLRLLTPA
jgi:long-chain acyl-CoA synthetase